jgi:hypothetical protein
MTKHPGSAPTLNVKINEASAVPTVSCPGGNSHSSPIDGSPMLMATCMTASGEIPSTDDVAIEYVLEVGPLHVFCEGEANRELVMMAGGQLPVPEPKGLFASRPSALSPNPNDAGNGPAIYAPPVNVRSSSGRTIAVRETSFEMYTPTLQAVCPVAKVFDSTMTEFTAIACLGAISADRTATQLST